MRKITLLAVAMFSATVSLAGQTSGDRSALTRLDRYGEPLPPGAIQRFGSVDFRFPSDRSPLAFSPDGRTIATSAGATIVLGDLASGKQVRTLSAEFLIYHLRFSPDGRILVAGGGGNYRGHNLEGVIAFWNTVTGALIRRIDGQTGSVYQLCFSPDGKILASRSQDRGFWTAPHGEKISTGIEDKTVRLWEVASGKELLAIDAKEAASIAFSEDGETLRASGRYDPPVRSWEIATGRENLSATSSRFLGSLRLFLGRVASYLQADYASWRVLLPGDRMFTWDSRDRIARLKETGTGKEIMAGRVDWLGSVAFSPDGKVLATVDTHDDALIRIWNTSSAQERLRIRQNKRREGTSIAISPDGRTLASGSDGHVRLWDLTTGEQLGPGGSTATVNAVVFSPDGGSLASGDDDGVVRLWHVASGRESLRIEGQRWSVSALAVAPDGGTLASGGPLGSVVVRGIQSGETVRSFQTGVGPITSISYSPEGRLLAYGQGYEQGFHLWNLATGELVRKVVRSRNVQDTAVAFSPTGQTLASGDKDGTALIWDVASGQQVRKLESSHTPKLRFPKFLAFSPDGSLLAAVPEARGYRPVTVPGSIVLWNVATGEELARLEGHELPVSAVSFSPDG